MIEDAVEAGALLHLQRAVYEHDKGVPLWAVLSAGVGWKHEILAAYKEIADYKLEGMSLSLGEIVSLGAKPFFAPRDIELLDSHWMLSHPINLAAMFGRCLNDPNTGQMLLDSYVDLYGSFNQALDELNSRRSSNRIPYRVKNTSTKPFWVPSWVAPPPESCGLTLKTPFEACRSFTSLSLHAYLELDGVASDISHAFIEACAMASSSRKLKIAITQHAMKQLAVNFEKGAPAYGHLATLLRVVPRETAETRMAGAKGVRQILNICRRDSRPEAMKLGLQVLGTSPAIKECSALYGRAPTVEELMTLRSKSLLNVVYHLPLTILHEVLDEPGAAAAIRAKLFMEIGNDPDRIRECLIPHNYRVQLAPYPFEASTLKLPGGTTVADWDRVFGGLARTYLDSKRFRKELWRLVPNHPATRLAFCSWSTGRRKTEPALIKLLGTHPKFDELEGLVKSTVEPTLDTGELAARSHPSGASRR